MEAAALLGKLPDHLVERSRLARARLGGWRCFWQRERGRCSQAETLRQLPTAASLPSTATQPQPAKPTAEKRAATQQVLLHYTAWQPHKAE